jgi:hypothetical protein
MLDFNKTWIFSTDFRKNLKVSKKFRPVGTELYHVDGQTEKDGRTDGQMDGHEENRRFSQFCERA